METQASLVVPKDNGELEMFVSTQNAHKTQVSRMLFCRNKAKVNVCYTVTGC